jgi:glycosyltransferase involved in cell wall biosynthesis
MEKVSIVVPTLNTPSSQLEKCLESLVDQTYPDIEILIVEDPRSTVDIKEVVEKYQKERPSITMQHVLSEKPGPSATRNKGIEESSGIVVAFTDSDCQANSDWIANLVKPFESDDEVRGVRGNVLPIRNDLLTRLLSRTIYIPSIHRGSTDNIAYKREALFDAGLLNEKYKSAGSEDADLARRMSLLNYRIEYQDSAIVYHDYNFSYDRFFKREFRFGRGFVLYLRRFAKHGDWRKPLVIGPILFPSAFLTTFFLSLIFPPLLIPLLLFLSAAFFKVYRGYINHVRTRVKPLLYPMVACIYFLKSMCYFAGIVYECVMIIAAKVGFSKSVELG